MSALETLPRDRRAVHCMSIADNKYLSDKVWVFPGPDEGLTVRPIYDERAPESRKRISELVSELRPSYVCVAPHVLRSMVGDLGEIRGIVRAVFVSSSDLPRALRQEAELKFAAPVFNVYGLSEFGVVASECQLQNGLHIHSQFTPEVLVTEGDLRSEGTGELVLSSLSNAALPLIRYRTLDIVDLELKHCVCGFSGASIKQLKGRSLKNFKFANGFEYSPTNFNFVAKYEWVNEYRVTQTSQNAVLIEVEIKEGYNAQIGIKNLLIKLNSALNESADINIKLVKFGKLGKFERYINLPDF